MSTVDAAALKGRSRPHAVSRPLAGDDWTVGHSTDRRAMTTSSTHLKRAIGVAVVSLTCFLVSSVAMQAAWQSDAQEGCAGTYAWPVKPFDQPHQIRGEFGDPRTQFAGPPTLGTLLRGSGKFSFHEGVDITAPDGTAVYPVASGTVTDVTTEWVGVECGNGRSFEYWHIDARVRVGQMVGAGETVLGVIQRGEAHIHLTQREDGRATNPVAPGRLTQHEDTTTPEIHAVMFRKDERGPDDMAADLSGRVNLLVDAVDRAESIDTPGLRTPGIYRNWPVSPARLSWSIERWNGRVVVSTRVARDVRRFLPEDDAFWSTFARGTSQNQSVFGKHYSYLQHGRFLFKLTSRPFDTQTLRDGVYDLVVTASDIAGHRAVTRVRFTVRNGQDA